MIPSFSPQSHCTGEYGSTPTVPLKPHFFLSASARRLILSWYHNKRLRFFSIFTTVLRLIFSASPFQLFSTLLFSFKMAVPAILRNNLVRIENFKFLESSVPSFHCQCDANAFSFLFLVRRRVRMCQSGGMAHTPRTVPFNAPIERITAGCLQVVIQFSTINFTNRIRKLILSTSPQLTACHKWQSTTIQCLLTFSQNFHYEECPR